MDRVKLGKSLLLAAWACFIVSLFLPALEVSLSFRGPLELPVQGWEAAVMSLAMPTTVIREKDYGAIRYASFALWNLLIFFAPLQLLLLRRFPRLPGLAFALSCLALADIARLPWTGGMILGYRVGFYVWSLAFLLSAAGGFSLTAGLRLAQAQGHGLQERQADHRV